MTWRSVKYSSIPGRHVPPQPAGTPAIGVVNGMVPLLGNPPVLVLRAASWSLFMPPVRTKTNAILSSTLFPAPASPAAALTWWLTYVVTIPPLPRAAQGGARVRIQCSGPTFMFMFMLIMYLPC
jgi:hypothetical protein